MHRQPGQAERREGEHRQAIADHVGGALNQAVDDAKADIAPRQPIVDAATEIHEGEGQRDRIKDRRLFHQMIVIVGFPLRLGGRLALQVDAARAIRDLLRRDSEPPELAEAADEHPHHDYQGPRDERYDRRENWAVGHEKPSPRIDLGEGASLRFGYQPGLYSKSFAKRRFSRLRQAPRCHASLARSGSTLVASANTICSIAVETLPHDAAS
jgi:hypothetical protein